MCSSIRFKMRFSLFALPKSRPGLFSTMPWGARGSVVPSACRPAGVPPCPAPPRPAAPSCAPLLDSRIMPCMKKVCKGKEGAGPLASSQERRALAVPRINCWFCSPIGLHRISFVLASEDTYVPDRSARLEGARDGRLLGEPFHRRSVLPSPPAPPRRAPPRPAGGISGFWIRQILRQVWEPRWQLYGGHANRGCDRCVCRLRIRYRHQVVTADLGAPMLPCLALDKCRRTTLRNILII